MVFFVEKMLDMGIGEGGMHIDFLLYIINQLNKISNQW